MKIIKGDIHKEILKLPKDSYNLLYTNPPYNKLTKAKWDKILDWDFLFNEIFRVLKENGVCVLHSTQKFTVQLCSSGIKYFKYKYIWIKNNSTNFLLCKKQF